MKRKASNATPHEPESISDHEDHRSKLQRLTEGHVEESSGSTYCPSDEVDEFKGEGDKENFSKSTTENNYFTRSRDDDRTQTPDADFDESAPHSTFSSTVSNIVNRKSMARGSKRRNYTDPSPSRNPNIPNNSQIQATDCLYVNNHKTARNNPVNVCCECARGKPRYCRFQNFRVFEKTPNGDLIDGPYFTSDIKNSPAVKHGVPLYSGEDINKYNCFIKALMAEHLSRMLKSDLEWLKKKDIIIRGLLTYSDGPSYSILRQSCEFCSTSLFAVYFICCVCGAEICKYCYERLNSSTGDYDAEEYEEPNELRICTLRRLHCAKQFFPVSCVVTYNEAMKIIKDADNITCPHPVNDDLRNYDILSSELSSVPSSLLSSPNVSDLEFSNKVNKINGGEIGGVFGQDSRGPSDLFGKEIEDIPTHPYAILNGPDAEMELFEEQWNKNKVVTVNNLNEKISSIWNPEWFCKNYGDQKVRIYECRTANVLRGKHTVKDFFPGFEYLDHREDESCVWKLKDWPPKQNFEVEFPVLYENFEQVLPFKPYTHKYGSLNLASRLPRFHNQLDLGPKMYIAYGSPKNSGPSSQSFGTTNLHMDMADAVNIMMYAVEPKASKEDQNAVKETPGCLVGAIWHIYRIVDVPKIRKFLTAYAMSKGLGIIDPIHDQCFYLDQRLRRQLWEKYGVFPYEIIQSPGTAVFIPAGSPHQVYNLASCIKVAMDFVSPQSVSSCQRLTREFSLLGRGHPRQKDLLGLKMLLYYAWKSLRPGDEYVENEAKKKENSKVKKRKFGSKQDKSDL